MEIWKYLSLCVLGLFCFIGVTFTVLLLLRITTHSQTKAIKLSVIIVTVISSICCTLCMICDLIHISKVFTTDFGIVSNNFHTIMAVGDIFLYNGDVAFYSLLILRVNYAFMDSVYKLNKCFLWLLWATIIVAVLLGIAYITFLIIYNTVLQTDPFFAVIFMVIEFVLDILLSFIFIYKLFQVIFSLDITDDIQKSTTSTQIINVIIRHCILFGIVIAANVTLLICYMFWIFVVKHPQNHTILALFCYLSRSLENLCIVVVLFLNLKINRSTYRYLCKKCHFGCLYCCMCTYRKRKNMIAVYNKM
eukprot:211979_1